MLIQHVVEEYGPRARNRLVDASDPTLEGARSALESFYFALNNQDAEVLRGVWSDHFLAQLNNPLGGILRGGDAVCELYEKIFAGPVRLEVTFGDIVEYAGHDHAVFAGRETGQYIDPAGAARPLVIRTSRYFRYQEGGWRQYHHHGSIDDPEMLAAYQRAIRDASARGGVVSSSGAPD